MASIAYIKTVLNRLEDKIKSPLYAAFEHLLDTGGQIGGVQHQEKAINYRWVRMDSTTATVANEEFSIAHGMGTTPLYVIPVVPLDSSGVWLPRLKVTRAADPSRLYLSSPDTGVQFTVFVEY